MSMIARSRGIARRRPTPVTGGVYDDFASTTRDTTKWPTAVIGSGLSFPSGRARMAYTYSGGTGAPDGTALYSPPGLVNLTAQGVEVRRAGVSGGGTYGALAGFKLYPSGGDPNNDFIAMFSEGASGLAIYCRHSIGYSHTSAQVTLPANHLRWRVRSFGGAIVWETSPDSQTWTQRRQIGSVPFSINALTMILYSLNYDADGQATNAANYVEYEEVRIG